MPKISRELKAVTVIKYSSLRNDEEDFDEDDDDDVLDENGLFSFDKWNCKTSVVYKSNAEIAHFYHKRMGRRFKWTNGQLHNVNGEGFDQCIVIRCTGRSIQPIKDLLKQIKAWSLTREVWTTDIFRSAAMYAGGSWNRQLVRSSRPIVTVALDDERKVSIITDINEYLHPVTARWYSVRGIPYRRGYLFYRPPGTGKTSLSFLLGGIFGLII
jgi:chaperone BCS1